MADLVTPPLWLQSGSYGADDDRALLRALISSEGIAASGDLLVAANGTPNMTVNVAAGRAFVRRTGATDFYLVENDSSQSLAIAASDPTNARKDIVVARVYDSAFSGSLNKATLEVVTGTPNAVPVEPAVPNNALKLAAVTVGAGVSSVTAANISDSRISATRSGAPLGALGYAEVTADQGTITTEVDLTGLSKTVTVAAGRRIRVTGFLPVIAPGSNGSVSTLRIKEGATQLAQASDYLGSTVTGYTSTVTAILTPSAGLHTYKLTLERAAGSGNLLMQAAAGRPAYILVEDIGPV